MKYLCSTPFFDIYLDKDPLLLGKTWKKSNIMVSDKYQYLALIPNPSTIGWKFFHILLIAIWGSRRTWCKIGSIFIIKFFPPIGSFSHSDNLNSGLTSLIFHPFLVNTFWELLLQAGVTTMDAIGINVWSTQNLPIAMNCYKKRC